MEANEGTGALVGKSAPGMPGGGPLTGRRLPDARWGEPGGGWEPWKEGQAGDYLKILDVPPAIRRGDGVAWYIRDPSGHVGRLATHDVTEHEDGSISVSPSILRPDTRPAIDQMDAAYPGAIAGPGWHGFLERGVWRSV